MHKWASKKSNQLLVKIYKKNALEILNKIFSQNCPKLYSHSQYMVRKLQQIGQFYLNNEIINEHLFEHFTWPQIVSMQSGNETHIEINQEHTCYWLQVINGDNVHILPTISFEQIYHVLVKYFEKKSRTG